MIQIADTDNFIVGDVITISGTKGYFEVTGFEGCTMYLKRPYPPFWVYVIFFVIRIALEAI